MKPSCKAVLDMLREAGDEGVTTGAFVRAFQPRFSARLHELTTRHGVEIDSERLDRSSFRYWITHLPDDLESSGGAEPPRPVAAVRSEAAPSSVPAPAPSPAGKATDDAPEGRGRGVEVRLFDTIDLDIPPTRPRLLDVDEAA